MSYVTVGNKELSSATLPSNANGHSGSMSAKTTSQRLLNASRHRMFPLAMVALVAVAFGFNPGARAQDVAPPISGALGQVQSVGDHSITIQDKSGLFHIDITQPLTTYKVVPSDLNHITDNAYIGVASTELPDGTEVAKQIFIFPSELRGAVEGSVAMDAQPGATTQSRMTNGSVSLRRAPESHSRMTNGVVQKGTGTTLVVNYQDGAQTISVPPNVAVVSVVPGEVQLAAGETAYAKTDKQTDGTLSTHMILVIGGPPSGNTK
ncbi:hypothetical protein H7849_21865 [Alloacidobacterium dinghuense]|uniref:DUF5666 domain-containing protein n=1 Tax=Alloacidobacterium dinghuense TaxID=2763107 RepID=A0A7G8BGK4_9BACT|nr:hypothetical protein [Alloacidobacterium dinghuense]QNI31674.1 hypothetical protein H7849_21865 [Alloacidobacterium dinghuense]